MPLEDQIERGKVLASAFLRDDRGQATNLAQQAVGVIVAVTVAALVSAFLIPVAIDELANVSTTSWSSGASSMWDILDVIIVLAVFLFIIAVALSVQNET